MDFIGYGIGGLSVGEPKPVMYEMLDEIAPYMPVQQAALLDGRRLRRTACWRACCAAWICSTACWRRESPATARCCTEQRGASSSRTRSTRTISGPIDAACDCYACQHFSRAYVRHLLKAGEITGATACKSIHNLRFLIHLMEQIREAIANDCFLDFRKEFYSKYDMSRNF